MLGKVDNHEYN